MTAWPFAVAGQAEDDLANGGGQVQRFGAEHELDAAVTGGPDLLGGELADPGQWLGVEEHQQPPGQAIDRTSLVTDLDLG
jgi:hypothetical protein